MLTLSPSLCVGTSFITALSQITYHSVSHSLSICQRRVRSHRRSSVRVEGPLLTRVKSLPSLTTFARPSVTTRTLSSSPPRLSAPVCHVFHVALYYLLLQYHHPHLRNNYACTPPNPARPSNCCNTRISPANCLTRRSLHAPPTSRDPRETCDTLPRAHCTRNIDPSSCSHLCNGPTRRNALASVTYVGPSLGMPPLCSFTPSTSAKSNASTPRTTQTR